MPLVPSGVVYATPDDFRALGLPPGALDNLPDPQIARFLSAACRKGESLGLRARYHLPLEEWDDDLVQAVCQLAVWPVMTRRGYNTEAGANAQFKAITLEAEEWFRQVGERVIHPRIAPEIEASSVPQIVCKPSRGITGCR